jgi:hypothetical protein
VAAEESEPGQLFLAASYLTLFVGGIVLAVFEAFLLPYSVSTATNAVATVGGTVTSGHVLAAGGGGGFGQLLSVGLLVVVVANPLLSLSGFWMAGTRLAAITPLLGWLPLVLILASGRSTGTVVLSSSLRSSAFMVLGAGSFLAVAAIGRPTRGAGAIARRLPATSTPPRSAPPRPPARKSGASRTAPKGGRRR